MELSPGINRKLCAQNGTLIIDDTDAHTGLSGVQFITLTDTVVSVCTGTSSSGAVDYVATYNWVTLPAGTLLVAPDDYQITAITLTSGSIALY